MGASYCERGFGCRVWMVSSYLSRCFWVLPAYGAGQTWTIGYQKYKVASSLNSMAVNMFICSIYHVFLLYLLCNCSVIYCGNVLAKWVLQETGTFREAGQSWPHPHQAVCRHDRASQLLSPSAIHQPACQCDRLPYPQTAR